MGCDVGIFCIYAVYIGSPRAGTLEARLVHRGGADAGSLLSDALRPLQGNFGGQLSLHVSASRALFAHGCIAGQAGALPAAGRMQRSSELFCLPR